MKKQYLRQGTVAVNWLQLYELDFPSILASDATDELTKVSTQLLYGDFRALNDPQYHAYCYAALQALQMYGQYLAGIYHEQVEKLTEAQNFYLKAEMAPETLKKRLEEYQAENKHLKEVVRNITQMNSSLMKKFVDLKDKFNSVIPLLQMLPKCRCGKTFINKDTLLQHMKTSHPHWPIPPEYEEQYFDTAQRPQRSSSTQKRAAKRRQVESSRGYQNSDDGSYDDDDDDYESQDSDPGPTRKAKSPHRNSRRLRRQSRSKKSAAPRSHSNKASSNHGHAENQERPYEQSRSYSSYAPQSHLSNPRYDRSSAQPAAPAAPLRGNGQPQHMISYDAPLQQVTLEELSQNNLRGSEIEALVERAIARSLSAYRPAVQSANQPTDDTQRGLPLPPPSAVTSYGPPYLSNQICEQQTLAYHPEDYEICPTSKTELKSPIGFRQTIEATIDRARTTPPKRVNEANDPKPPPSVPVPNYVSSQLGSESLPALPKKDSFPRKESMPPQHRTCPPPDTAPSNPTILQATAPVVTSKPSATFVQPPDNILSPLHIKPQAEQPAQEVQEHAPTVVSQASRESTLFAEDTESHLDANAAENIACINDALTDHVRENWPELFQKPETLPYNLDLTEPEILRRISVLNRSINNAVAANNFAHSSISGYHSSLSTYEEYGSTINDISHRS